VNHGRTLGRGQASAFPAWLAAGLVLASLPCAVLADVWPLAAVLVVAVGIALAVCLLRPELALLLLVGTIPLESSIRLGGNPQLTTVKVAGALCFASWTLAVVLRRRVVRLDRAHAAVLGLLALALVSTTQAAHLQEAEVTTLRYASFAGLFVVLTQYVGDHRLHLRVAWVLSVGCTVAALLGLGNFATGATPVAKSLYGDVNDYAYVLATTLPLTFSLLRSAGWARRLTVCVMLGSISAAVLLSFSRGALVGIGAALVWELVIERRNRRVILGGVVVAAALTAILIAANYQRFTVGVVDKSHVAGSNVENRFEFWGAAVILTVDHPLLGVGPGNFQFYADDLTGQPPSVLETPTVVHDVFLDISCELGLLGVALFVGYLVISFRRLGEAVDHMLGPPGWASAVRTAFIIAVVGALTLSEQYYAPLWLLGGLATSMWYERSPEMGALR
jgi:putative inorganic carbon (hco3(-)) transporter